MRLAILSDSHDNLWNLRAAIDSVSDCDALIHCGDLCSPFVVDELARFPRESHVVFGNNDADLFRITSKAAASGRVKLHGEVFTAELGGKKVFVNHFDYIARPVIASGEFDLVCFGHNHIHEVGRAGRTRFINPGPIMGAKFSGGWKDVAATFAIYDTETDEIVTIDARDVKNEGARF